MVHFVTLVSLYVILLYQIKVRLTLETWVIGKTYIYDSNLEYFTRGCFFIDYRTHCNIMIFFLLIDELKNQSFHRIFLNQIDMLIILLYHVQEQVLSSELLA